MIQFKYCYVIRINIINEQSRKVVEIQALVASLLELISLDRRVSLKAVQTLNAGSLYELGYKKSFIRTIS